MENINGVMILITTYALVSRYDRLGRFTSKLVVAWIAFLGLIVVEAYLKWMRDDIGWPIPQWLVLG